MRRLFQNLGLALLALLLAFVVWVVAVSEENPVEQRVFPRPFPIAVTGLPGDMFLVEQVDTEVTVTIRAPRAVWTGLASSRVHVTVDLSELGPGEHAVPVIAHVDDEDAEVIGVAPNEVRVVLERITSRTLPVVVSVVGEPATGYEAYPATVSATSVRITGPAAQVEAVSDVALTIDISNRKESLARSFALRPTDRNGQFVPGLELEPDTVDVLVELEQLESYRDVAVRARIEGEVSPGYRITNITITPSVVTVFSSDPHLVATLPGFVETDVLNIADASDDVEARLTPQLPEGVSLVGGQAVLVQVGIAAIESSLTMQQVVKFTGLEPGLAAQPSPEEVELILSGPLPVLDTLTAGDVTVLVDLRGLDIGAHQLSPQVIVAPKNVEVESVLPDTILVEIEVDTSTPTSTSDASSTPTPSRTPSLRATPTLRPTSTVTPAPTVTPG